MGNAPCRSLHATCAYARGDAGAAYCPVSAVASGRLLNEVFESDGMIGVETHVLIDGCEVTGLKRYFDNAGFAFGPPILRDVPEKGKRVATGCLRDILVHVEIVNSHVYFAGENLDVPVRFPEGLIRWTHEPHASMLTELDWLSDQDWFYSSTRESLFEYALTQETPCGFAAHLRSSDPRYLFSMVGAADGALRRYDVAAPRGLDPTGIEALVRRFTRTYAMVKPVLRIVSDYVSVDQPCNESVEPSDADGWEWTESDYAFDCAEHTGLDPVPPQLALLTELPAVFLDRLCLEAQGADEDSEDAVGAQ